MTAEVEPAVNSSALSGVRFLITRRIEDLETTAARLEATLSDTAESRDELRRRTQESERRWQDLMDRLATVPRDQLETAFRSLARLRSDLAAAEERVRDLGARLLDMRSEQEVMRSVFRSLDDLAAGAAPAASAARMRSASRQVFQVIEEERMRIARDMHDGPAQSMANLVLQAEILERLIQRDPGMVVKELSDFKDGVRAVLDDTRRLIFDLRPMTLDDLGLVPTLRKFVREFADRAGVEAQLRVVGEESRLPQSLEPTIFRIVQEALNNARKHARARSVEVVITFAPEAVHATVRDDGIGMDLPGVEARLEARRKLGLVSMRERAELEKGILQIRSQPGQGTEVRASFPVAVDS